MKSHPIHWVGLLLLLGTVYPAAAQHDTLKMHLDEVVVTATRSEKPLAETGRSVSVITRDDIRQSGAFSVSDLLSRVEGAYIVGNGQTPGANQSIFLRGANSNQTAVLIDGVRISDASTVNNTIDLSELSLNDIERIEISRGSQGTLYGTAAVGGVINIITHRADEPGFHGGMIAQGGVFGPSTGLAEGSLQAGYAGKSGWFAGGFFDRLHADGLDATADTVTDPSVYKNRDRDGWDKTMAGFSGGLENRKWSILASYRHLDMLTDLDKGAYTDDDNYTLDFKRHLAQASAQFRPDSQWQFHLSAAYSETKRVAVDDSSVIDEAGTFDHTYLEENYSGRHTALEGSARYTFSAASFAAGYSYTEEKMNQRSYYYSPFFIMQSDLDSLHPHARMHSAWVQADLNGKLISTSLRNLNIVSGIRMYSHTFFDTKITGEVNPTYRLGEHSLLCLSWSGGYNVPSLYQLYAPDTYVTWDNGTSTGITRGNKSLKPETSSTFELGVRHTLSDRLSFSIFLFHSRTKNIIEYVYLWNGAVPIDSLGSDFSRDDFRGDRYLNAGTLVSEGVEFGLSAQLHERVQLRANITLAGGRTEISPDVVDPAQTGGQHVQLYSNGLFLTQVAVIEGLVRRPSTANFCLRYNPWRSLLLSGLFQYTGQRADVYYDSNLGPYGAQNTKAIAAYSITTFEAGYTFNRHFSVSFRVENIFDTSYEEIYGFNSRGRGEYLKISARW